MPQVAKSTEHSGYEDEVALALETAKIPHAPVVIDLSGGKTLGICGNRDEALSLIHSLTIQAATAVGPADLSIAIFSDSQKPQEWDWAGWLPHTHNPHSPNKTRFLGFDAETSERKLKTLHADIDNLPTPLLLLIIDSQKLAQERVAPARLLSTHNSHTRNTTQTGTTVSSIFYAPHVHQLPASCTHVISIDDTGVASLQELATNTQIDNILSARITLTRLKQASTALARFEDPEIPYAAHALPTSTHLLPLLGIETKPTIRDIETLWNTSRGLSAPVGIGTEGILTIDLIYDGPHGLVGGTTGSGKSEFLRTLIAGLAARYSPEKLNFILIDFKGGAAFASCERLPHVIGTITNLDAQIALRAVKALEAEIQYREKLFANTGPHIDTIEAYNQTHPAQPLARIVFVVDEFAQLAHSYPETLSTLIATAALGRTLGIHIILATQRPASVVSSDILANTNLRVALRMQSKEDSTSVISVPLASAIARENPGRAYVRLGENDVTPIQTALVSGQYTQKTIQILQIMPTAPHAEQPPLLSLTRAPNDAPSDLPLLIDAICEAHARRGNTKPRTIWLPPLDEKIYFPLHITHPDPHTTYFALSDDPEHQRHIPSGWNRREGNIIFIGTAGFGTTTALLSLATQYARSTPPDQLDIIALDFNANELAPLAKLPHTIGYASRADGGENAYMRALTYLYHELNTRLQAPTASYPTILCVIDGFDVLRDIFGTTQSNNGSAMDIFQRIYTEGRAVGILCAMSSTRTKSLIGKIGESTRQKWAFHLTEIYDYSSLGKLTRNDAPPAIPGRCVNAITGLQTQILIPPEDFAGYAERICDAYLNYEIKADKIAPLPALIKLDTITEFSSFTEERWRIPIAISEKTRTPTTIESWNGEHILVTGPVRSGKTTTLIALAEKIRQDLQNQGETITIYTIAGARSALSHMNWDYCGHGTEGGKHVAELLRQNSEKKTLILIDDSEALADTERVFYQLYSQTPPTCRIITTCLPEETNTPWITLFRKSRCGILLMPDTPRNGEALRTPLPRHTPQPLVTGRGYICSGGKAEYAHIAIPLSSPDSH